MTFPEQITAITRALAEEPSDQMNRFPYATCLEMLRKHKRQLTLARIYTCIRFRTLTSIILRLGSLESVFDTFEPIHFAKLKQFVPITRNRYDEDALRALIIY